jgi:hypothetical protein
VPPHVLALPANEDNRRGSITSTEELAHSLDPTSPRRSRTPNRRPPEGKVLWHSTMSLDGFVAGPNHAMDWMTGISSRPGLVEEYVETTGAVLGGRDGWDQLPDASLIYGGAWQGPVFVLTHHPEDAQPAEGVTSLSWDVAEAVRIGLEAAGKNLEVLSPTIGRQLLERGLIDQIDAHRTDPARRWDPAVRQPRGCPVRLEPLNGDDPSAAVSLRYHPVATQ